jgi:hypothetical protein
MHRPDCRVTVTAWYNTENRCEGKLMKPWDQRETESAQAYAAFCIYLNLRPDVRTLDNAYRLHYEQKHGHPVGHVKKAPGRWRKWSTDHNWQSRTQAYDADQQRKALIRAANKRQKEVEQFVQSDMMISLGVQRITSRKVAAMMQLDPLAVDASELRLVVMAYDTSRTWLAELIGFIDEEASALTAVSVSDEALAERLIGEMEDNDETQKA